MPETAQLAQDVGGVPPPPPPGPPPPPPPPPGMGGPPPPPPPPGLPGMGGPPPPPGGPPGMPPPPFMSVPRFTDQERVLLFPKVGTAREGFLIEVDEETIRATGTKIIDLPLLQGEVFSGVKLVLKAKVVQKKPVEEKINLIGNASKEQ
ncbi:hypothetical protein Ciccas_010147 [Cichlidogyrus casuarinus]|uniref:Uncharacterized protein n=1 Tax=Cichlidogyrus casuarinus TaxID=1844966 RepID=A0ABD2PUY8_9PLAT